MYPHTKINFLDQGFQRLEHHRQTDTETDAIKRCIRMGGHYRANNVQWNIHAFNRAGEWKAMRNISCCRTCVLQSA